MSDETEPSQMQDQRAADAPTINTLDLMQCRTCRSEREPIPLVVTTEGSLTLYAVRRETGDAPAVPTVGELREIIRALSGLENDLVEEAELRAELGDEGFEKWRARLHGGTP